MHLGDMREGGRRKYPFRIESNCLLPVEMRTTFLRWWWSSIAVMKPVVDGRHFWIASFTFSTLTSLKPLILRRVLRVAPWTDWGY